MSTRARQEVLFEGLFIVDAWIEEALASQDAESDALVAAKRANRDSYSFENPPISGTRARILSDLKELSPMLEAESPELIDWLESFQPSLRYVSKR
jgi:hypothetical protein